MTDTQMDTIHHLRTLMLAIEPLQTPESVERVRELKERVDAIFYYERLRDLIEGL